MYEKNQRFNLAECNPAMIRKAHANLRTSTMQIDVAENIYMLLTSQKRGEMVGICAET